MQPLQTVFKMSVSIKIEMKTLKHNRLSLKDKNLITYIQFPLMEIQFLLAKIDLLFTKIGIILKQF